MLVGLTCGVAVRTGLKLEHVRGARPPGSTIYWYSQLLNLVKSTNTSGMFSFKKGSSRSATIEDHRATVGSIRGNPIHD